MAVVPTNLDQLSPERAEHQLHDAPLLRVIDGEAQADQVGDPNSLFDHEVFGDHELIESRGINVGLENVVDGEDAEYMWQMYQRGFSALNASTLSRQSLDEEEFKEELADPGVIKYMARNPKGVLVGYMAVEKGLFLPDASPYWPQQDDDLLSAVQAEVDPNAPSFYISSFLVDKKADEYMLKTSKIILQGALRHFREVSEALEADPVCFYDFAPDNSFLPVYITETGKPDRNFEGVEIDTWPVYVAEWYRLDTNELTPESLRQLVESMPEDAFSDLNGQLNVEDGVPLEIQPENLEGEVEDYATVTNLPSARDDLEGAQTALTGENSVLQGKKYVLINLKRLGEAQDPVDGLGERLSYQSFVAQKLKDSPVE